MRLVSIVVVSVFLCGAAIGADYSITINDSGFWLATANGPPTLVTSVVDLRTGHPNPPPPGGNTISEQVEKWAREINDPITAAGLSEVYRVSAEQLASGTVNDTQSLQLVQQLTDRVLALRDAEEKWAGWRVKVTAVITHARQGNNYDAGTLTSIQNGLAASYDDQALGDGKILEQIIKLIEILLPLILKIIAGL